MKEVTNECVNCGFPCKGVACPNYRVTRYYCDDCGNEETLYHFEGGEYCLDCIKDMLKKVEGSDY